MEEQTVIVEVGLPLISFEYRPVNGWVSDRDQADVSRQEIDWVTAQYDLCWGFWAWIRDEVGRHHRHHPHRRSDQPQY